MKPLLLLLLPLLAACEPEHPCMAQNEAGTVVKAGSESYQVCGRGGCSDYIYTTVTLTMPNGVTRVCRVSDTAAGLFTPGQKLSLPFAERVL